jgi:LysR family transcriptional regulator, low CO2-responsive transcriptional regulator
MRRNPMRRYFRHGMLPQLVAFEAVVRHGSVTRAADELALAQPTVSCMLRKLGDAFGAPLVVLRDRRVEATALGREVLLLSEELLESFARFERRSDSPRADLSSRDDTCARSP